ncbi:hypothetical protein AB6E88_10525 [Providencia hangzhouensis]
MESFLLKRRTVERNKKEKKKTWTQIVPVYAPSAEWFFSGICMDLKSARVCVVVATNEKRLREFGSSSSQRKENLKFFVF